MTMDKNMINGKINNGLCSHVVNIGIYDYKPNHGCSYIYGSIHSWGTKKGKKKL